MIFSIPSSRSLQESLYSDNDAPHIYSNLSTILLAAAGCWFLSLYLEWRSRGFLHSVQNITKPTFFEVCAVGGKSLPLSCFSTFSRRDGRYRSLGLHHFHPRQRNTVFYGYAVIKKYYTVKYEKKRKCAVSSRKKENAHVFLGRGRVTLNR